MQKRIRLGDILLQAGLISNTHLQDALRQQGLSPDKKLGDILIEMKVITQKQLADFLGKQMGIPTLDLSTFNFDLDTIKLIPENLMKVHRVIPIKREKDTLTLAMVDPLDIIAIDNISNTINLKVKPVFATSEDISRIFSRYFGEEEDRGKKVKWEEEEIIPKDISISQLVDNLIQKGVKFNSSDVHLEPREKDIRVRYRIDGVTHDFSPLDKDIQSVVISRIKVLANMDITETRLPQDGRFKMMVQGANIDVRVSTMPTLYGEKVAMRIFNFSRGFLKLEKIGFAREEESDFKELIRKPYGMIVIAGPTGVGKSTTFYAILNELNIPEKSIFSLEDPVEYPVYNINQAELNPKIGLTYATGLRALLRQIPDAILLGEIRDEDTAKFAIESTLAGALMLCTFHAYNAVSAITRLTNMNIEPYLICSSLIAVVSQRLIRILCPDCKAGYSPNDDELKKLGISSSTTFTLYSAQGCKWCFNTGYRGRTGIFEILKINDRIKNLILKRAPSSAFARIARESGITTLKDSGMKKVMEGVTTIQELQRVLFLDD